MNKINGSAIRKVSAENPATAHTRDRYAQLTESRAFLYSFINCSITGNVQASPNKLPACLYDTILV